MWMGGWSVAPSPWPGWASHAFVEARLADLWKGPSEAELPGAWLSDGAELALGGRWWFSRGTARLEAGEAI